MAESVNVLIVDDSDTNLLVMEKSLAKSGANLVMVTSGGEAMQAIEQQEFALAILDIQMPEMDGFELALRLREHEKTTHLPIIFITAIYSDQENISYGYETGAVDYLVKPVNPLILLSKVRVFLICLSRRRLWKRSI